MLRPFYLFAIPQLVRVPDAKASYKHIQEVAASYHCLAGVGYDAYDNPNTKYMLPLCQVCVLFPNKNRARWRVA